MQVGQQFSLQLPKPQTVSFLLVSGVTSTCYSGYEIVRQRHRKKYPRCPACWLDWPGHSLGGPRAELGHKVGGAGRVEGGK